MKPQTIVTIEGIYTLDSSGFYVPYIPPEPKSVTWMYYWVGAVGIAALVAWVIA
jgi:hypothetical protein